MINLLSVLQTKKFADVIIPRGADNTGKSIYYFINIKLCIKFLEPFSKHISFSAAFNMEHFFLKIT